MSKKQKKVPEKQRKTALKYRLRTKNAISEKKKKMMWLSLQLGTCHSCSGSTKTCRSFGACLHNSIKLLNHYLCRCYANLICIFILTNIRQTGLSFSQGYSKLATTKYRSFITPVLKHNLISSKLAIKTGLVNTETHQRPFSVKCTMGHTLTLLQSHSSTVLSRMGFHSLQYVLEMSSTIKSDYGI